MLAMMHVLVRDGLDRRAMGRRPHRRVRRAGGPCRRLDAGAGGGAVRGRRRRHRAAGPRLRHHPAGRHPHADRRRAPRERGDVLPHAGRAAGARRGLAGPRRRAGPQRRLVPRRAHRRGRARCAPTCWPVRTPRTINMSRLGEALTDPTLDPPVAALVVWNCQPARHRAERRARPRRAGARRPLHRRPRAVPHRHRPLRRRRAAGDDADRSDRRRAGMGPPVDGLERGGDRARRRVVQQHGAVPPARRGDGARGAVAVRRRRDAARRRARRRRSTSTSWPRVGWVRVPYPDDGRAWGDGVFPTASGKVELVSEALVRMGQPALPTFVAPREGPHGDPELVARYPLQLLTPKQHARFLNSGYSHLPKHGPAEGGPFVELDPTDAAAPRHRRGRLARVWNDRASLEVPARISGRLRPGVVAIPFGWWQSQHPDGKAANALTNDTLTEWGGGVAYSDTLVQVAADPERLTDRAAWARPEPRKSPVGRLAAWPVTSSTRSASCGCHCSTPAGRRSGGSRTSWPCPGARVSRRGWSASSPRSSAGGSSSTRTALAELGSDGARLRSWDVDLNPFKSRSGEVLIGADVIDQPVGDETVSDVALQAVDEPRGRSWHIAKVRLVRRNALRRKPSYRLVDVDEVAGLFPPSTGMAAEAARLRDLHPAEVAAVVRALPVAQRRQLAAAMDDDRLADLLEELPESEQVQVIEGLDLDRLIGVLDEMELDDLADLLGEMSGEQQRRILEAMDDDDAAVVRSLLSYEASTAGGMMTPEVVLLGPTSTVAEALAQIRQPDLVVSIAAQVFVCQPPVQGADRQAHRHRPLPAAAPRAAEHGAAPVREHRPGRRPETATMRSPSCWRATTWSPSRCANRRPAARRRDHRRRAGPSARGRLAPARRTLRGADAHEEGADGQASRRPHGPRARRRDGAARLGHHRPVQRDGRPQLRHRALPRHPDGGRHPVDHPQRHGRSRCSGTRIRSSS